MAKKIKFGLDMADGYPVRRDLEELREHFDPVKAIEHFASGKLSEWLSDRYYDDIAEQLDGLDKDAPGFPQQLCKVLGVEASASDDEELDVERIARTKEKETRLRQKTSDETIIANAAITAFDRSDLVELWDDGAETIYLCGDAFDIPASVGDTKYIGVLGTPKITIKAKSPEDLADKGILFENVELPEYLREKEDAPQNLSEAKNSSGKTIPIDQLKELFDSIYADFLKPYFSVDKLWDIVDLQKKTHYAEICNDAKKQIILNLICKGKYKEEDLIHVRITKNFTAGWALTKDSFCYGGAFGNGIIPYSDIENAEGINSDNEKGLRIYKNGDSQFLLDGSQVDGQVLVDFDGWGAHKIENYLKIVKNLYMALA